MSVDVAVKYAWSLVGKPYIWGGDDPIKGFDCSGLAQEILASVGLDPQGDQTAQGLFNHFRAINRPLSALVGDLAFYGRDTTHLTHVGFVIDGLSIIEAGGGDSKTVSSEAAARQNAFVRVRPIVRRQDYQGVCRPKY